MTFSMMAGWLMNVGSHDDYFLLTVSCHYVYRAGMKLNDYLTRKELSAADFARRIGVCRSAVGRWVAGDRVPSVVPMRRIIAATNGAVLPNDFFEIPAP